MSVCTDGHISWHIYKFQYICKVLRINQIMHIDIDEYTFADHSIHSRSHLSTQ